jgi:hypothetical protein
MVGRDLSGLVLPEHAFMVDYLLILFSALGKTSSVMVLEEDLVRPTAPIFAGEETAVLLVVLTVASEGWISGSLFAVLLPN